MEIIIIFLVIILIIIFLKSNFQSSTIEDQLFNGLEWADYRIGDVYMLSKKSPHYSDPTHPENLNYHKTKYPGTIASEYINKNTSDKNPRLLLDIIDSKTKDKSKHPDTLFLHMRVGDVICNLDDPWIKKVNGPMYYSKMGDTTWWNNILDYIHKKQIRRVVIVAGTHKNQCLRQSAKYIEDRKAFLIKSFPGITVDYRLGQSPDDDIIMCSNVEHFITTGGGFGKLIKEINITKKY